MTGGVGTLGSGTGSTGSNGSSGRGTRARTTRGMCVAVVVTALALVSSCSSTANLPTTAPTDLPDTASTSESAGTPTGSLTTTPTATANDAEAVTSWGPSLADVSAAEQIVAAMDTSQQAGQVIVARVPGTTAEAGAELVSAYGLGGFILFAENIEWPGQIAELNAGLQRAAVDAGRTYPLILGVDQEGGTVARVTTGLTEMPAYMTLGAARDPAIATATALASGEELRALGFTMVFAPDADVTIGVDDPTIGTRSASSDPAVVADVVTGSVRGYLDAGIVPVVKHFPGHGSVPADSHEELPEQDASLDDLRGRDLVPFVKAVAAGVPAVMVGHIDVREVDPGVPSSVSSLDVAVLRDELGFEGLAVTDALEMEAVVDDYDSGEAAVAALAAGEDMLLMPLDVLAARNAIVAAVGDGSLPAERLADAATSMIATAMWQKRLGAAPPSRDTLESPAHHEASYNASLAGLTVVEGPCEGALVEGAVQVAGGTDEDRVRFSTAAAARGLMVGAEGPLVRLLDDDSPGSADIVVALDRPYGLGRSSADIAAIALYGRTPDAFAALVDVLLGTAQGHGQLPVEVDGAERSGCP